MRRTALPVVLLLAASHCTAVFASDAQWLQGRWRITHGLPAPWLDTEATRPDVVALVGEELHFDADRARGPSVLSCANATYEPAALPPQGLFQGNLPESADTHAANLSLAAKSIDSVTLNCDTGLFDFHRAGEQAALFALDNVIWVLDRAPGAFAPDGTPEHALQRLLEAHFGGDMGFLDALLANKRPWLGSALQAKIATYFAQPFPEDEVPPIDGDPFTDSQEYPVRFAVGDAQIDGERAVVPVRYDDGYRARRVEFHLLRENDAWKLDDIAYDHGSRFTKMLAATPE